MHANLTKNKRIVMILCLLAMILFAVFLFWGITSRNIHFYLPRRWIKVVSIVVVSYCIAYSSVVFQTITNNNILTPSVMGLDSLYLFIQTAVVFFFGSRKLEMLSGYPNFFISVALMVGASWLLYRLLFQKETKNVYLLVLSGMVVGQLFGGMSTFMQVLLDPNEFTIVQGKMFASFNNINSDLLSICMVIAFLVLLYSFRTFHDLDALSLGADHAINLGVNYDSLVKRNLLVIAILVSVSTVLVGPITFLGILVASLSRKLLVTYKHSYRTLGATLLGCIFLCMGMLLVERIFAFETTIGVMVNFIGGAYFLYLMIKERSL